MKCLQSLIAIGLLLAGPTTLWATDLPVANEPSAGIVGSDAVQDLIVWTDSKPILVRLHVAVDGMPLRKLWRENLDLVYDELDRDRDGVLNRDEAKRAPALDSTGFPIRIAQNSNMPRLDQAADSAGNVNRDTFMAHYARTDAAAFTTRTGQGRGRYAVELFALLDSNKDRQLSGSELKDSEESLRRRDYDDDDIITEAEIVPGQNPYAGLAVAVDRAGANPSRSNLVLVLDAGIRPSELANALLERYDTDKDKLLTVATASAEVRFPEHLAAALDINLDGRLDAGELGRFTQREPDLELRWNLVASKVSLEVISQTIFFRSPLAYPVQKSAEGYVVLDAGDVQLEIRDNPANPAMAVRPIGQIQFNQLDRDNNGYLDKTELGRLPFLADSFAAMDRDGDGQIVKVEYDAYFELQNKSAASRVSLEVTDDGQQVLDLLDTNRDGRLTLRELRAAGRLVDTHDSNHDSAIGGSEIPRRLRFELTRGNNVSNQFARPVVVVNSGIRQPSARGGDANTGSLWFRKMDRNHDGDLSPREFLGPREDFDRLDQNHDGLIDSREAESARSN